MRLSRYYTPLRKKKHCRFTLNDYLGREKNKIKNFIILRRTRRVVKHNGHDIYLLTMQILIHTTHLLFCTDLFRT